MKNTLYRLLEHSVQKDEAAMEKTIDEAVLSLRCLKLKMPVLPAILDDLELQSIKMPALFIVGEEDRIYPARDAIMRLETVAHQIETEVIAHAGHDLAYVQADVVNRKVRTSIQDRPKTKWHHEGNTDWCPKYLSLQMRGCCVLFVSCVSKGGRL